MIEQKAMFWYACKVEKHDIMGIVHRAWIDSFARKESNKQEIRDRGWVPLVYKLLDHEELKRIKNQDAIKHAEEISMLSGHEPNGLR